MKRNKEVDEYISKFPRKLQEKAEKLRNAIEEVIPEESIEKISWKMPTFYLKGNLVHFAIFKNHIGFYPTDTAIEKFKEELKDMDITKGSLRISHEKDLPIPLIQKIVKYRVKENLEK